MCLIVCEGLCMYACGIIHEIYIYYFYDKCIVALMTCYIDFFFVSHLFSHLSIILLE